MIDFSELAALTVHDVKNRLAVLAARADTKGDAETLRDALSAAASLTQLLTLYKAEKGRLQADIDARVPSDLLEELAAEFRRQSALAIELDLAGTPTLWYYDEGLVRMVLQDALYNASRHARTSVVIAARTVGGDLEFSVRDDGPGYPPSLLAGLPEVGVHGSEGTGLGLHLAGRVAAMHAVGGRQGSVELSNDSGAVFHLRLPR